MQALDDAAAVEPPPTIRRPLDEVLARARKHPLLAVGIGVVAGYLLARVLDR